MVVAGLFVMGAIAGVFGALMGIGGGIFLVPLLTFFFHLPIRAAVGTSLVAVIATSAGVAAFAPKGKGADISLALRLEMATTAAAIAGGWLAGAFHPRALHILFGLVTLLTAGYMVYKTKSKRKATVPESLFRSDYKPKHWPIGMTVSSIAGLLSGLLGVGGGFIKVPVMYAVMDVPLGVATATSNFMVGVTAAASVFVYYSRGDIHPFVAVPTAVGVFGGAMLGAFVLSSIRASWVRTVLIGLLFVIGAHMLVQGLHG